MVSVVADEDHDRPIPEVEPVQRVEQTTNLRIHERRASVVGAQKLGIGQLQVKCILPGTAAATETESLEEPERRLEVVFTWTTGEKEQPVARFRGCGVGADRRRWIQIRVRSWSD